MKRFIPFLLLLFVMASCKSLQQPVQTTAIIKDSVVTVTKEKLVRVVNPADSANLIALLECDENGKVIAKRFQSATSKNAALSFQIDSLSQLIANFHTTPKTIYVPVTDTEKNTYRSQEQKEVVEVERPYGRWVTFCIGFTIAVLTTLFIKLILFIRTKIL